jgi:hypothetical protein
MQNLLVRLQILHRLQVLSQELTLKRQVELWFAKVERDVIARGVFTFVTDLRRSL